MDGRRQGKDSIGRMRRTVLTLVAFSVVGVVATGDIADAASAGGKCSKVGQTVRDSKKKVDLVCTKVGKTTKWVASRSSSGSGSGSGSMASLQGSCATKGSFSWSTGLLVCADGKWRYALPSDIPAMPAGGYTSRPSWYPTLHEVMSPFGTPKPSCTSSSIRFTQPVVPTDKLAPTIPYGMMTGDHVTPIDHAYLGLTTLSIPEASRTAADYVKVTAPADGTITELSSLGSPSSNRVVIDHGCGVYTVYMVLNKPSGLLASAYQELLSKGSVKVNISIKAGQEFGQQRDNPLDFNVFDASQWLPGFVGLSSYLTMETWKPYTADYLPFFSGSIRTAMEDVLQRTSAPRVGKIDHDVAGSAAGNWFLSGTYGYAGQPLSAYANAGGRPVNGGQVAGKNFYSYGHLAIAPHWVDTSKWVLSTGWKNNPAGDAAQYLLVVPTGGVAPNQLTASRGTVVYDLASIGTSYTMTIPNEPAPVGYTVSAGASQGTVALRVNADGTLSLEFGSAITSAARTYTR